MKKLEVLWEKMVVLERGRGGQDNEQARDARKNWNVFENCLEYNPICAKHTFFVTGMSREQVAMSSRQNLVT